MADLIRKAEKEVLRMAELVASWSDPNLFADPKSVTEVHANFQARSELFKLRRAIADLEAVRRVAERD